MTFNRFDGAGRTYFPKEEETQQFKMEFAVALLRNPDEPFAAARLIFGDDTARAMYASINWVADPDVKAECARLLDEFGEEAFLPTKAEYARTVWKMGTHPNTPIEEKAKLLTLYGDIRGFRQSPGTVNVSQVNVTNNRVMVVKDHGTELDWEKAAAAQQHRLVNRGKETPLVAAPVRESDIIDIA